MEIICHWDHNYYTVKGSDISCRSLFGRDPAVVLLEHMELLFKPTKHGAVGCGLG